MIEMLIPLLLSLTPHLLCLKFALSIQSHFCLMYSSPYKGVTFFKLILKVFTLEKAKIFLQRSKVCHGTFFTPPSLFSFHPLLFTSSPPPLAATRSIYLSELKSEKPTTVQGKNGAEARALCDGKLLLLPQANEWISRIMRTERRARRNTSP